ncbi:hypothetical protein RchiOBHm_Chr2g0172731 [Rosa chinensis]|uniref:Uncharacterized protein n=1 Tax=Rosa chinensis TaxID=74649 RepID=A0A2P6S5N5_ROSCH|nr:hypothetical protein RchiOBHm_Chr2g0172731 [Rosa chinensis]
MSGRLWGLWETQTVEGLLCLLLGRVNSLWSSILVMCVFSVFVQAAAELTFGRLVWYHLFPKGKRVFSFYVLFWFWGFVVRMAMGRVG